MCPSLTLARFQRSIAEETCTSSELISEMMLCSCACFELIVGSAVASAVTPSEAATMQKIAGMCRVIDLMSDSPAGDRPAPVSLQERHKVGRVTAFSDDFKKNPSQKEQKACLHRASQRSEVC